MPDIFISYSRKDAEQAMMLSELLTSAGLSCWIDQSGIEAATSWSEEIVNALDACTAFVVMLSPSSIESKNVVREVALAFEKNKKILPLDLEPVSLPASMQYHLAGLQRTSMTNIDSVIRALSKLGLEATGAPQAPRIVKETDGRKSLMILPFEDLSPTGDNGWFADGIVSELISALSNIKSLRIADAQETKEFKSFKGHLTTYAKEMSIRYFVQGDVRKFGDQIKISARLLDIDTGDHLWQEAIKGTMADVFEIQEQVAQRVVDGLKLHLSSDEMKKLMERGTENTEAYELSLKAYQYFNRGTKEGYQLAAQLFTESIRLDPGYASAYRGKADALANLNRNYDPDPSLLEEGESLCKTAIRLRPDEAVVYMPLSSIYLLQGKYAEAEAAAMEYVRLAPMDALSHFTLGFFYTLVNQPAKAIAPFEESVRLKPEDRSALFNLAVVCASAKEVEKCAEWSRMALPIFERHLKLHPDDENAKVSRAIFLAWSGRSQEALRAARPLKQARDSFSLYHIACLFAVLGEKHDALETFRTAIDAGFRNIALMHGFLAEEEEGIAQLRSTPEYEEVKQIVKGIEQEAKNNA